MTSRVPKTNHNKKIVNSAAILHKAKSFYAQKNLPRCFEYFVHYFESLKDPAECPLDLQNKFVKVVCELGSILEESNYNVEELLKCYIHAINLFPNNYVLLNTLGAYMFRLGEMEIARRYLESALAINENYLPAEKNLLHVKWYEIPRWHFRMLNDRNRNVAYYYAITAATSQGYSNVMDIGAGCGLLSLIASQNPLVSVTAIEENKTLFKICQEVLNENNITNVQLLNCTSSGLESAPAECNLVVTEIFDVALFGERALDTLIHATSVLVTSENFKVIPASAKVYATGIQCKELANKFLYNKSFMRLHLNNICIKSPDTYPYEAENLIEYQIKYLTGTGLICNVDFYNTHQLYTILHDEDYAEFIELTCTEDGIIHALAVWFDLNLSEEISITTNPLNKDCVTCWEQAVFYLDHPVSMKKGEKLKLKVTVLDSQLKFSTELINTCTECFEVTKEIITFLNDEVLTSKIQLLSEEINDSSKIILDVNPFPLFGLLLAKRNFTVYHIYKKQTDLKLIEHLLNKNCIDPNKFILVNEKSYLDYVPFEFIHVAFLDPVNVDGSWNKLFISEEKFNKCNILFLPEQVSIKVQLIESWHLENCNKVDDSNVFNFNIAKHINEYMGNEQPNIENFTYTELSNPLSFKNMGEDYEETLSVQITRSGTAHALLYWFDIRFLNEVQFSTLGSTHYKKSCFLVEVPKIVKTGDVLRITVRREDSYLKMSCI